MRLFFNSFNLQSSKELLCHPKKLFVLRSLQLLLTCRLQAGGSLHSSAPQPAQEPHACFSLFRLRSSTQALLHLCKKEKWCASVRAIDGWNSQSHPWWHNSNCNTSEAVVEESVILLQFYLSYSVVLVLHLHVQISEKNTLISVSLLCCFSVYVKSLQRNMF